MFVWTNSGCFQIPRTFNTRQSTQRRASTPARRFGNALWDNETAQLVLVLACLLSVMNTEEKRPLACSQPERLTSEMLVHFTFDRLISTIIEKRRECRNVAMALSHVLFQSIIASFHEFLWGKVRLVNLTVAWLYITLSAELRGEQKHSSVFWTLFLGLWEFSEKPRLCFWRSASQLALIALE